MTFEVIEEVPAELKGSRTLLSLWNFTGSVAYGVTCAEDTGIAAACISVSVFHCVGKPPVSLLTH